MSLLEGAWAVVTAILGGGSFEISAALREPGAYLLGPPVVLIGAYLILLLFRKFPWMDRHFERSAMIAIYLTIAMIICVEVVRRFVFQVQAPWSTTLPPYLFLLMAWTGCAANVRTRSHLSFSEFRSAFPRPLQLSCLLLDTVLWLTFSVIVVITTLRQTANSASNFQILPGTDSVMQWWFYAFVSVTWIVLSARVLENFHEDIRRYRSGAPLTQTAIIGEG